MKSRSSIEASSPARKRSGEGAGDSVSFVARAFPLVLRSKDTARPALSDPNGMAVPQYRNPTETPPGRLA